jgi:endonuclease/exonuclease/phosphatase family metal-dependent hydrolase
VLRKTHQDISDHRFEQRGLLHVAIEVEGQPVHAIVVHLGLIRGSRVRQVALLREFIEREIPPGEALVVAGDFNDWGARMRYAMNAMGLRDTSDLRGPRTLTYPSRLPVTQLDFIYGRQVEAVATTVPRGPIWARMSDHLPLVADFVLSKK